MRSNIPKPTCFAVKPASLMTFCALLGHIGNVVRLLVLSATLLAQPAIAADRPISPAEFEALVTGKTLSYSSGDQQYGTEEYFEGRRVRWAFANEECIDGRWYDAGERVCFVYEGLATPQCWAFYLRDDRLMARFENDPVGSELHEIQRQSEPLFCPGPEIGA